MKSVMSAMALAIGLTLIMADSVWADEPTPTPFPTLEYRIIPTDTWIYTVSEELIDTGQLIPVTGTITATVDAGLWSWENFQLFVKIANTTKYVGNTYHVWDLLFAFVVIAMIIPPLIRFVESRGEGSG